MNTTKKYVIAVLVWFALMLGYASQYGQTTEFDNISTCVPTIELTEELTKEDSLKQELSQVDSLLFASTFDYVSQVSKRSSAEKKEIAQSIIEVALDKDIDICFMLAQGTIETHLGSAGIGRTRKSMFGVYRTYSSYRECVQRYGALLSSSYLVHGKTHEDLMRNYVNARGMRYAGNPNYEAELRAKYDELLRKHREIRDLQIRRQAVSNEYEILNEQLKRDCAELAEGSMESCEANPSLHHSIPASSI